MVNQVIVAERNTEHAFADKGGQVVLDALRRAGVLEAGGEALDYAEGAVRGPR